jgi:hypothetical protein
MNRWFAFKHHLYFLSTHIRAIFEQFLTKTLMCGFGFEFTVKFQVIFVGEYERLVQPLHRVIKSHDTFIE